MATAVPDSDSSVEIDCLSINVIKPYNVEAYDDSDNTVVSEPGRFDVDAASGTAAITIGISHSLQNYCGVHRNRPLPISIAAVPQAVSTPNLPGSETTVLSLSW